MIVPRHFCKEWPLYNASENSPNPLTIPTVYINPGVLRALWFGCPLRRVREKRLLANSAGIAGRLVAFLVLKGEL